MKFKNSKEISEPHRSFLIGLIDKTKSTIPLLTNENLLDNQYEKLKLASLQIKLINYLHRVSKRRLSI